MCIDLNVLGAILGGIAAILWFLSAKVQTPPPVLRLGGISEDDPFMKGLQKIAYLNKWAATLTGVSVLCMALAPLLDSSD
jgi:hypothetical protein